MRKDIKCCWFAILLKAELLSHILPRKCILSKEFFKNKVWLSYRYPNLYLITDILLKSNSSKSNIKHILWKRIRVTGKMYSCTNYTPTGRHTHMLVHTHTRTHTPVVGSIDIHLIQRLLITVPAQGEYFQRHWNGYWHNNRLVLWRTEPMYSLLFFLLWPQVNKLTGPPGEQALAPWRQHWYAIWWIYSNYCCHARPAVWPRLQGSEGWGEILNISAGGGVRGGGASQSVSNIEAPQVTLLQDVRSSEQRETKAN